MAPSDNTPTIYPGTFDPLTYGHLDLITRGSRVFERLIVAVAYHTGKDPIFDAEERKGMIIDVLKSQKIDNVEVEVFKGLLVNFVQAHKADKILRGVRAFTDFEYEFQMALMNRKLAPEIETIFMMPNENYSFISSRLVKQIVQLGGSLKDMVPPVIEEQIKKRVLEKIE